MNLTPLETQAAKKLIDLALTEDLHDVGDLTCRALIGESDSAEVNIVVRDAGVLAGEPVARLVFNQLDPDVQFETHIPDGSVVEAGSVVASLSGRLRSLLTGERTALNFLTHLSGVASLTRQFVDAVTGNPAVILDTRKTLPGYRLIQKYAVRAGGGTNHRMGLYDGILIKDNHLAAWAEARTGGTVAAAIRTAHESLQQGSTNSASEKITVEVEVDTLHQLADALTASPDIVLLDNMDCGMLVEAVALRDERAPNVLLEASGGVTLETVAEIAATGVERISVGALTHSAPTLDLAFDWNACSD